MKKVLLILALPLMLTGCTEEDIKKGIQQACGWVEPIDSIKRIVTGFTGSPPIFGIAWDTSQAVIKAVCEAHKKAAGPRGLRGVRVPHQVDGSNFVPLTGCRANDAACRSRKGL